MGWVSRRELGCPRNGDVGPPTYLEGVLMSKLNYLIGKLGSSMEQLLHDWYP